jgi:hypothetical protein
MNAGAAAFGPFFFQSLIACGISLFSSYNDHTPLFGGGWQLPFMFPPFTSAIAGPEKIGQVHWDSSKSVVVLLTAICFPSGVQVEAAQRAKSPVQILNSWGTVDCASAMPDDTATIAAISDAKEMSRAIFIDRLAFLFNVAI